MNTAESLPWPHALLDAHSLRIQTREQYRVADQNLPLTIQNGRR